MADEPQAPTAGTATDPANAPRLTIQSQYVKDLSFENPRAPATLQSQGRPEIQIRVDVRTQKMDDARYEVTLQLHVDAKSAGETVFMVELTYGGLFGLQNIPQDSLQPLLLIECPRLLFPFARRIVADATRDGGYPPLMVDPIDFVALFRRRQEQAQAQAASNGDQAAAGPAAGDGASSQA